MGTDKRERKKANRAARLAAEQAAETRARRKKAVRNVILFGVGIVIVAVLLSLVGCAADDDDQPVATGGDPTATSQADGKPQVDPSATGYGSDDVDSTPNDTTADDTAGGNASDDAPTEYGSGECPPVDGVEEPVIDFDDAPQRCIDPAKAYTATFETTEGDVTVALDAAGAPITVNNFVVLARYGYYDGTDLFRTEAGTGIIQGGAPHTQSNTDPGPGYTIPDENLPYSADDYGPGALAMARTAAPDSAGAQFFLLANEGARYLGDPAQLGDAAGSYVVFGQTTGGLDVLEAIAALDDGSRAPRRPVTIEKVTITES